MTREKHRVIILIIFVIVIFSILCGILIVYILTPSKHGVEYEKNWSCKDFDISFNSNDEKFPYVPNVYDGVITIDDKAYEIKVIVDYSGFAFGTYGVPYTEVIGVDEEVVETSDFITIASGEYKYDGFNFIVTIDNVKEDRFKYLSDKKLVFTEE